VRRDLERVILANVETAGLKDRASNGRTKWLTGNTISSKINCELLKDAKLPEWLSPHSFLLAAVTDLPCNNWEDMGSCELPGYGTSGRDR
jgi:hypothetical protein